MNSIQKVITDSVHAAVALYNYECRSPTEFKNNMGLMDDLGMDTLDILELSMYLEEMLEFSFEVEPEKDWYTVGDVVASTVERLRLSAAFKEKVEDHIRGTL